MVVIELRFATKIYVNITTKAISFNGNGNRNAPFSNHCNPA
jgi:hypothetical protein